MRYLMHLLNNPIFELGFCRPGFEFQSWRNLFKKRLSPLWPCYWRTWCSTAESSALICSVCEKPFNSPFVIILGVGELRMKPLISFIQVVRKVNWRKKLIEPEGCVRCEWRHQYLIDPIFHRNLQRRCDEEWRTTASLFNRNIRFFKISSLY